MPDCIEVIDAYEHNLKHIDVSIPRDKLVVVTGISGSGKSSLAFDTIFAEGQRRYIETFDNYTRMMVGGLERPAVEKINGLSPVISIEQKTTGWNPRSTLGTVTEVYDLLRLLYARTADAYSYISGKKMVKFSEDEIIDAIVQEMKGNSVLVLAPIVKGRKGHYKEVFDQVRKQGYSKVRIDDVITPITPGMQVDRYKIHDIELVIDKLTVSDENLQRLISSVRLALKMGDGIVFILNSENNVIRLFSRHLADPENKLSYEEPNPNTFSFNSPYGACPDCLGLGQMIEVDLEKIFPDKSVTINKGGIAPLGLPRNTSYFDQLQDIAKKYKFTFASSIHNIPEAAMHEILYGVKGSDSNISFFAPGQSNYDLKGVGLIEMIRSCYLEPTNERMRLWAEDFMSMRECNSCHGDRLKTISLHYKIADRNISELSRMSLTELGQWFADLDPLLDERQRLIGKDVVKEISMRINFLNHVGLGYLSLDRSARTLSGGESQRARLANQIGTQLSGVLYILDEPSIGLHQRDNHQLITALQELVKIGNTVMVVEHDKDIMLAADHLVDIGPRAGMHGGKIVAQGTPAASRP